MVHFFLEATYLNVFEKKYYDNRQLVILKNSDIKFNSVKSFYT